VQFIELRSDIGSNWRGPLGSVRNFLIAPKHLARHEPVIRWLLTLAQKGLGHDFTVVRPGIRRGLPGDRMPAGTGPRYPMTGDDGQHVTFDALYMELSPGLVRYLRWKLQHSCSLAEDIAQETFLILARKWPEVRNHPNLRAWLYKVARHLMFDALERHSRELLPGELPDQAGASEDPSDSYHVKLAVWEALGKLPPRQREAVWLFYFERFKQNEIAAIMQIQRGMAAALLSQARDRLAELLGD
jgi:RNA polymerase sigma factor (sigma-70 family)